MNKGKLVSVIITTRNEEDTVGRLIESIKNQTFQNIEIILVDNSSTDKTVNIAKKFKVKVFNFGPERSAQRNYGAKMSKGDYLLFLDADMELSKDVIKECVESIENNPRQLGAISIPEKSIAYTFWERVKSFERSFYNLEGDSTTDAARYFTKKVFDRTGGYDEAITGPEDWDLHESIKKLGFKIGRIKSVIYHYERIKSLFDLYKKKFYYGLKSHRYLSKQNVSTFSPKTIYFLRPVFYKNFDKILAHPVLALGMCIMFTVELIGGGLGYLIGKVRKL